MKEENAIASIGKSLEEENESATIKATTIILEEKPLNENNSVSAKPHIPSVSASAVLGESASMPEGSIKCRGYDFNQVLLASKNDSEYDKETTKEENVDGNNNSNDKNDSSRGMLDGIMDAFLTTGFQATNIGLAIKQIQKMRQWRLSDTEWNSREDPALQSPDVRKRIRARVFLGYTSNQISSGQREIIRFLTEHKMIDAIVTTAGGIEEDIIKCFEPTYIGDFKLRGRDLRKKGINRIGNLLVPNKNYCDFEDWLTPLLAQMHTEQETQWIEWAKQVAEQQQGKEKNNTNGEQEELPSKFVWTPSKIIQRLGKEINHEESVLYWAAKNDIPVFCPALTDGSIGDMLYFQSYKRKGLVVDINEDVRKMNDLAVKSHATGMVILGGGLVKHHICNANLMRNGADFSVYINTGQEFDGSDSGASPDEAISWGKIRITAQPVKVSADATVAFPLIVSQTFAKNVEQWKEETKDCVCWVDDL